MQTEKIYDENGQGFTRIFASNKVEKVNPVDYYKSYELEKRAISFRDLLNSKDPLLTSQLDDDFFYSQSRGNLSRFF